MTPLEEFWVDGAEGAKVQSFMVKPPNFTPGRKYPVLMLIHGGPQGFWGQRGPTAGTRRSSPPPVM